MYILYWYKLTNYPRPLYSPTYRLSQETRRMRCKTQQPPRPDKTWRIPRSGYKSERNMASCAPRQPHFCSRSALIREMEARRETWRARGHKQMAATSQWTRPAAGWTSWSCRVEFSCTEFLNNVLVNYLLSELRGRFMYIQNFLNFVKMFKNPQRMLNLTCFKTKVFKILVIRRPTKMLTSNSPLFSFRHLTDYGSEWKWKFVSLNEIPVIWIPSFQMSDWISHSFNFHLCL